VRGEALGGSTDSGAHCSCGLWDGEHNHDGRESSGDYHYREGHHNHAGYDHDRSANDHDHAATGYHDHGGLRSPQQHFGQAPRLASKPLDWLLASINANNPALKTTDPSIKVFRRHLLGLEKKTTSDQQAIADITVKAWQIVTDEGYDDSLLRVMEELDRSIPDDSPKMDLPDIGAAWIKLRTSG